MLFLSIGIALLSATIIFVVGYPFYLMWYRHKYGTWPKRHQPRG